MSYVDGFVIAVPTRQEGRLSRTARQGLAPLFKEWGATRHGRVPGATTCPTARSTDFKGAVKAEAGETVVFAWIEYPSKAVRDAANQKMMSDPRMKDARRACRFDGKRMILWLAFRRAARREGAEGTSDRPTAARAPGPTYASPEAMNHGLSFKSQGVDRMSYIDGFVGPVPVGNKDAYLAMSKKMTATFKRLGVLRVVESWGSDVARRQGHRLQARGEGRGRRDGGRSAGSNGRRRRRATRATRR